jgi:hypothetical protein
VPVFATVASAQPAAPSSNAAAADAKIKSATAHYTNAEMGAALADLAEAYHLDPRPDLLYAMAHIEVELGDCTGAVAHLKQYLGTNPTAAAREAAEKAKAACEQKLGITNVAPKADDKPATPVAPTPIEPQPVKPAEPATITVERPFYSDLLGDGLAIGGLVSGATGGVLYLMARKDIDSSETAATLQAHEDLVNKAHDLRTYAVIAGAVGGALVIGAVVRWTMHGGGTETRERDHDAVGFGVGPSPDGTGWGIAALGRF